MDYFNLLLWIYLLVVSDHIPFRAPTHRQVPRWYSVSIFNPLDDHICEFLKLMVPVFFMQIMWAAVLMCHAVCHNFTGLMITRFLLGAFEAADAPGFSLVTGMWYTRREQPFRYRLWFLGNGMTSMLGGLLAYAIGHIDSGLAAWRYLFLIFGAVTALWGCVMFFLLPDTLPSTF